MTKKLITLLTAFLFMFSITSQVMADQNKQVLAMKNHHNEYAVDQQEEKTGFFKGLGKGLGYTIYTPFKLVGVVLDVTGSATEGIGYVAGKALAYPFGSNIDKIKLEPNEVDVEVNRKSY